MKYVQDKEQLVDGSHLTFSSESYVLFCLEISGS